MRTFHRRLEEKTLATHLFRQATGQEMVEVFPEGDRDFFVKVNDAQITFETDNQGRATSSGAAPGRRRSGPPDPISLQLPLSPTNKYSGR